MKIETEHTTVQAATHDLIDQRFQMIGREEDFIILMKDESADGFLQVDFEEGVVIELEYRDEVEKTLYRCTREVSLEEARKLFHDYLNQKSNWMATFPWKKVNEGNTFFDSKIGHTVFVTICMLVAIIAAWNSISRGIRFLIAD
jgi:hypothetical protein